MDEKIFDPVQLLLRANNATIASQAFRIVKLETDREEQQQMFLAASREISELQMLATNIERRAEEAETALAAMTAERDARDVAIGVLAGECFEWRLAHVCSPVSLIDAPIIRARKRTMENPIARAAVEGER